MQFWRNEQQVGQLTLDREVVIVVALTEDGGEYVNTTYWLFRNMLWDSRQ